LRIAAYEQHILSNSKTVFNTCGLGLANAYLFTTQHGGTIKVIDSINNKGATFKIELPYLPPLNRDIN